MPVHAVVPRLGHHVGDVDRLVLDFLADLAFGHRVAAELAGEDDQRAIEQAALVEVANQLRDRRVDQLLHGRRALVAVLVRVPVDERDVLGRDLDVAGAGLDQPAREQAALAEPAGVVGVEASASARATGRTPSPTATSAGDRRRRATRTSDSRWKSLPY